MRRSPISLAIILFFAAGFAAPVLPDDSESENRHWAYLPPQHPALPKVQQRDWRQNPIDHPTMAEMERRGLAAGVEVSRERLIRRATLDVTGLPPTTDEVDAFLADKRPDAYQWVVAALAANCPAILNCWIG